MIDRTRSSLMKAKQLEKSIDAQVLPSLQITQAQDAAEHAFRAILFGMSVSRVGNSRGGRHELDQIARMHRNQLGQIWFRLEPLLDEYAWLWQLRNVARYDHIDMPPFSDPPITPDMLNRAKSIVLGLIGIAESLI